MFRVGRIHHRGHGGHGGHREEKSGPSRPTAASSGSEARVFFDGVMSDLKVRPYALAMAGVQKAAAPLHSKRAQALAVAARS